MKYFIRAAQMQPKVGRALGAAMVIWRQEVKWRLMVASCHRRVQNYDQALKIYEVLSWTPGLR